MGSPSSCFHLSAGPFEASLFPPPEGYRWTLHCVRAGATSECNALDIAMSKIRRQGDWSAKSTVPCAADHNAERQRA